MTSEFQATIDRTEVTLVCNGTYLEVHFTGNDAGDWGRQILEPFSQVLISRGVGHNVVNSGADIYSPFEMGVLFIIDSNQDVARNVLTNALIAIEKKVNEDGKFWGEALEEVTSAIIKPLPPQKRSAIEPVKGLSGDEVLAALGKWRDASTLSPAVKSKVTQFVMSRMVEGVSLPPNVLAPFVDAALDHAGVTENAKDVAIRGIMGKLRESTTHIER